MLGFVYSHSFKVFHLKTSLQIKSTRGGCEIISPTDFRSLTSTDIRVVERFHARPSISAGEGGVENGGLMIDGDFSSEKDVLKPV